MIMTDELTRYQAATEKREEEILGRIAIASQRDVSIRHTEVEVILARHGLAEFAPGAPSDADLYRRLTSAAKTSRVPLGDGLFGNVLLRQVHDGPVEIVRRVVIEVVDGANQRLEHAQILDVCFVKDQAQVIRRQAEGYWNASEQVRNLATSTAASIIGQYSAQRGHVNGDALRSVSKRVIDSCHAISLRSTGSVYFIPRAHTEPLKRLEAAARELPGCQVDTLALLEEGEGHQRDLVRNAAEADLSAQCRRLLEEIGSLTADNTELSNRRKASLSAEFRQLSARIAAHEELLASTLQQTRIEFTMLQHSVISSLSEKPRMI